MAPWPRMSDYLATEIGIWAYCRRDPLPCGHRARLDLQAIIDRHGDVRLPELRSRLKCRCGTRPAHISLIPYGELRGTEIMEKYRDRNSAAAVEAVRHVNAALVEAARASRLGLRTEIRDGKPMRF